MSLELNAFLLDLNDPAEELVGWGAFWYGVWSHRRDARW
jgi:hypothetical protein